MRAITHLLHGTVARNVHNLVNQFVKTVPIVKYNTLDNATQQTQEINAAKHVEDLKPADQVASMGIKSVLVNGMSESLDYPWSVHNTETIVVAYVTHWLPPTKLQA